MNEDHNKFDGRSLLAILLCFVFYFAYNQYLAWKYPDMGKPRVETTDVVQSDQPTKAVPDAKLPNNSEATPTKALGSPNLGGESNETVGAAQIEQLDPSQLTFETNTTIYRFSQELGALESVILKGYQAGEVTDKPRTNTPIDLLDSPMLVQGITDIGRITGSQKVYEAKRSGRVLTLTQTTPLWRIDHQYTVPEQGYGLDLKVSFQNRSSESHELTAGLLVKEYVRFEKDVPNLGFLPGMPTAREKIVLSVADDTEWFDIEEYCTEETAAAAQFEQVPVDFFGFDRHYFLKVFRPSTLPLSLVVRHGQVTQTTCEMASIGYMPHGDIKPGESVTLEFSGYFGPKEIPIMEAYGEKLPQTVELGFFGFIARPLLVVIHGFYNLTGNYGLAIILLTVLLKILFYPLVKASSTSMHAMKKLNPQMATIREKYKDDRQRQQQELMKFMAKHKINPLKGCLPILPQVPVFFAFYQVLRTAIELRHAPFFGWIQDLSAMDPYFVTPILMGVSMVIQQRLTPTTGMDKTQEKVLMFMPIIFTVFMLTLPAGMTIYMLTNTVVGIAQQKYLYHKLDQANA